MAAKRMFQGRTNWRWFIAILALSWSAPVALLGNESLASNPQEPCEIHQRASLNLDMPENHLVLVPGQINQTPVMMYLDIGSPFSMLSQQATTRFNLVETAMGKGIDITIGTTRVQQYADTDFMLGDISYRQAHFLIDPNSESSNRYSRPEVIGVLGMDLLWKMDLELDLAHHRLNLYEHSHCGYQTLNDAGNYNVVPLQRDAFGNIFFPMELEGRKLEALLSTSSPETTLSTDITKRVYGFDEDSSDIESVTDANGHKTAHYRAMQLTASGFTLTDENVRLTEPLKDNCHLTRKGTVIGYTGCLYRYPLRLGSNVLSRLHVYIATQDNLMFYKAAGNGVPH